MNTTERKENKNVKWLRAAIFLLFLAPQLIPIAILALIVYLAVKAAGKPKNTPKALPSREHSRQPAFDDCPRPLFCFHKDKGEHHIRRGKEIDPWDRPDIDISKYQRNR